MANPTILDPEAPAERPVRSRPDLPPPNLETPPPVRPREPLGRRGLLWVLGLAVFALVLLFVFSRFDEYLRRTLEAKINQHLKGYTATLGHAHLSPFGLSLTLQQAVIRQQANPEPPVADIPRLKTSVEWRQILTGHLVADAVFDQPRIHVNLPQLRQEARDQVSLKDRGWQQALESIYPLKFNHIEMRDGNVVYIDEDPKHPFQVSHLSLSASNIRNIQSRDRVYPSTLHAEGVIFDTGRGVVDGNADFLAEPFPGVHVVYGAQNIPLDRLQSIGAKANLTVSGGIVSSHGEVEYGPKHREARIADATIRGLRLDYIHTAATAPAEKARGREVKKVAENQQPGMPVHIDRFHVVDGRVGLVNKASDHPFRFFVTNADLDVTKLSSGFQDGPATARLTGRFMGSGSVHGTAHFRADNNGPDFDLALAVENASLPALNDLLRDYGKLDVAAGTFSVYSEMKVRNGYLKGYVKPLFKDIKVYDPQQDKDKPVLRKLYEKVVGGLSHVLKNRPREQVATVADLSGPVTGPKTNIWEIVGNLVRNAFVKAILPGFDREIAALRKGR
jgi:Domain of Unknown Function (DUF748)